MLSKQQCRAMSDGVDEVGLPASSLFVKDLEWKTHRMERLEERKSRVHSLIIIIQASLNGTAFFKQV